MDIPITAQRLKEAMEIRKLRQVDLVRIAEPFCTKWRTKINKSDISQYLSGRSDPGQRKLLALSEALDVDTGWLMGLDVPMNHFEPFFGLDESGTSVNTFSIDTPDKDKLMKLIIKHNADSEFISKLLDQAQLLDLIYGK